MAQNFTIPRTTSHARSTSFPFFTSNPLDSSIEALLHKLKEAKPSTSASSICLNLSNIENLYNNINSSIQCPLNQQLLSLGKQPTGVENVLEGSLALIDSCSFSKDVLSLMKDSMLELQSCLRRHNATEKKDINTYMMSRKTITKMANKGLKNFHKVNSKNEGENTPILRVLGEAETTIVSTLKSILSFMTNNSKCNGKGWSVVAKFMHSKRVSNDGLADENEIQSIDVAISGLEHKNSSVNVKMAQELLKQLETLEFFLQEIEACLESISRCLLKTRVSLLNIISSC